MLTAQQVFHNGLDLVTAGNEDVCHFGDYGRLDGIGADRIVGSKDKEAIDLATYVTRRFRLRIDHLDELADFIQGARLCRISDRKSTRLNSSHVKISYAVFCL